QPCMSSRDRRSALCTLWLISLGRLPATHSRTCCRNASSSAVKLRSMVRVSADLDGASPSRQLEHGVCPPFVPAATRRATTMPAMNDAPRQPSFAAVVAALAIAQVLVWAALYYAFSSFVLPMRDELHWSETTLMAAFSIGLATWGAASYAVGAAIDRGHERTV